MIKERIGWIALDNDLKPHQPKLGSGWRQRTKPITVYANKKRASSLSPVGIVAEVFVGDPE